MFILLLTAWKFTIDAPEKTAHPDQVTLEKIQKQLDIILPNRCNTQEHSLFNYTKTLVYSLDEEHTLYQVPCTSGAYNHNYVFFVEKDEQFFIQSFAKPNTKKVFLKDAEIPDYVELQGMRTSYLLTNARFDINKQVITEVSLGRGLGDMFKANRWSWGTSSFILVESWQDAEDDMKQKPQLLYYSPAAPIPVWESSFNP